MATLDVIIASVRKRFNVVTGSDAEESGFDDTDLANYANKAERMIAEKTQLLVDSTTASVCQIAVSANVGVYPYSDKIMQFRVVNWLSSVAGAQIRPLQFLEAPAMDLYRPNWLTQTGDNPDICVFDTDTGYLRLSPIPTVSGTLTMRVVRFPLNDMVIPSSGPYPSPEISARYHDYLEDGILWFMFSDPDMETLNKTKAAEYEQRFLKDIDEIKRSELRLKPRGITALQTLNIYGVNGNGYLRRRW